MSMTAKTIGFLVATTHHAWSEFTDAFEAQLNELGTEVKIQYQSASGLKDLYQRIAQDFANPKRLDPIDILVTGGTGAALACKYATAASNPKLPIVFATAGDPVGTGLVNSLAHPGENLTGISNRQTDPDVVHKRVEIMRKNLSNDLGESFVVGAIGNMNAPNVPLEMKNVEEAAKDFELGFVPPGNVQTAADIHPVIRDLKRQNVQALYVCTDPLITTNADILNEWARFEKLPTMHSFRENCGKEGLMSHGPVFPIMFRRAAVIVDMILSAGANPGDIPVEVETRFEDYCNKKTATILGLKSLASATE
jgi:putative tryptophan/tyrosine transport system substrate-binding protein